MPGIPFYCGPHGYRMLRNGAQRREEGQRGKNINNKHQDHSKAEGIGLQRAGRLIDKLLLHQ